MNNFKPLTEGRVCKGGHNPPLLDNELRPAPPMGSGGHPPMQTSLNVLAAQEAVADLRNPPPRPTPPEIRRVCSECDAPWGTCYCKAFYIGLLCLVAASPVQWIALAIYFALK